MAAFLNAQPATSVPCSPYLGYFQCQVCASRLFRGSRHLSTPALYPISHCFLSVHSCFIPIGIIQARRVYLLVHSYIYNTILALSYSSDLTESFSQTVTMVDRVPVRTVNYFKDLYHIFATKCQMSPENWAQGLTFTASSHKIEAKILILARWVICQGERATR